MANQKAKGVTNMKSKHLKWTAVIILVTMGLVAAGAAQMHDRGPGMHRHFGGFLGRQLQLTDAQRAQIKSMWQADKPTITPLLQQLANYRKQMLAATAKGNFNSDQVATLANQQSQVMAKLMVEKQKLMAQVYNQVLTPEQRGKADLMRAKHEQRIDTWLQHLTTNGPVQN
jgi:Spy/CpxP family protein refolding chaperone